MQLYTVRHLFHFYFTQSQTAHLPKVLTLAAAEHADHDSNDENCSKHRQGDYQRLEIHCRKNESVTNPH